MAMKKFNVRNGIILSIVIVLLLATASATFAFTDQFRAHQNVDIETAEYIKGPVFYSGNQVRVAGTIEGTAFIAGYRVRIDGTVDGSLFVAGQEVIINGLVTGNIYAAGQDVKINGQVLGDVFSGGQRIHTTESSILERDMMVVAETVFSAGNLHRQLFAAGSNVVITGEVGDDVRLAVERFEIRDSAVLRGNIFYSSPHEGTISQQADVMRDVNWRYVDERFMDRKDTGSYKQIFNTFASIFGALLVWYVIYVLSPNFWKGTSEPLLTTPFRSMSLGLLILIATPIVAVIAMVTVIGLPIGLMASAAYLTSLYITKIIAAAAIGYLLADKLSWQESHGGIWLVLLGLVIITILTNIPIVSVITYIVMILGGLGALLIYLLNKDKKDDPTDEEMADY